MEQVELALQYPRGLWNTLTIIESKFDETRCLTWMSQNWWLCFLFSVLYVGLVFGGKALMERRYPWALRYALCMWSTGLAVFSLYACMKIYPRFLNLLRFGGFEYTVCDMMYIVGSREMGIWAWLFPLSKLPELFDTFFIIVRKSKLSFLHWYHHFSVFIYCWYSYAYPISTGVWFGTVNYTVHAIMYMYYAAKASGRNPPRWIARAITTLQLSQMFVGLFLNFTAIRAVTLGKVCRMDWFTVGISVFFYSSYALLFANFYYWTYLNKKKSLHSSGDGKPGALPNKSKLNGHVESNGSLSNGKY